MLHLSHNRKRDFENMIFVYLINENLQSGCKVQVTLLKHDTGFALIRGIVLQGISKKFVDAICILATSQSAAKREFPLFLFFSRNSSAP